MLRLSVSDLDAFRYWKASEESTLAELVSRLTKKDEPSPQVEAGRAFARFLETAAFGESDDICMDGWTFRFAADISLSLPVVRELKAEMLFDTPSGPVTLVGQCDAIGGAIHDAKLTESFDAERYLDSLQWRSYALMFGAREFVYDIFVGKYDRDPGRTDDAGNYAKGPIRLPPNGLVTITEYHPIRFYAYPNMRADVEAAVAELARVVVDYGIPKEVAA